MIIKTFFGILTLALIGSVGAIVALATPGAAADDPGFVSWQAESYPAVNGLPAGNWVVSADGLSVTQTEDSQPTVFLSPFDARGSVVEGMMRVNATDDDFFGFVIGFSAGDSSAQTADYLLIDWKKATQTFDFGDPSCTAGTTASVGMAISHVTGVPTADELWGHVNEDAPCSGAASGVEEMARAPVLGNMGWLANTNYFFKVVTEPDRVRVWVNNSLQIDYATTVPAGAFGFYAFSQRNVTFGDILLTPPPAPVPTPPPTPTPSPSPSPTPEPVPTPPAPDGCAMDVDGDGAVTGRDVAEVAKALPSEPGEKRWNAAADVNEDEHIDVFDLHMVIEARHNGGCDS